MKRLILGLALVLCAGAAMAQTPTFTPTPTNTPTPSPSHANGRQVSLMVPSGGTDSPSILLPEGASYLVTVLAPGTIDGTVSFQVSDSPTNRAVARTVTSGGSDVTVAAAKAVTLPEMAAGQLWIHQSTTAAADRTYVLFVVVKSRG